MPDSQITQKPLVSFIVTYYNEPIQMLQECIESILALSLSETEREIILVDDGSDVSPLNEMAEYREHLIYLRQQNKGVSEARNMGIQICKGQYIQFVDADDCLIMAGYEHCLDIVRFHDADMVIFQSTDEGTEVDTPYLFDGPTSGTEYMRNNNLRAAVWGYIFRKKMLIDLRFTSGIQYGEDEKFTPQLILRADRLYATDTKAYFYRNNPNSVTHRNEKRSLAKHLDDSEHVLLYLDHLAATLPAAERIALQRRVAQLSMDYIYNIIMLTRSKHQLEQRLEKMHKRGLFPLPERDYTSKYKIFRRMANSKTGRNLLLYTLPYINKER